MKKILFVLLLLSSVLFADYRIHQFYGVTSSGCPIYNTWDTKEYKFKGDRSTYTTIEFIVNNKKIIVSMPFLIEEL